MSLKGKEYNKVIGLEQYNQFKLDRKPRIFNVGMKYFLASDRLLFILNFLQSFVPLAKYKINVSENKLHK